MWCFCSWLWRLLAGGWSRRQWPWLLLAAVLLGPFRSLLGITTLRLGLDQPLVTVAHQLVAALLVGVLAALLVRCPVGCCCPCPVLSTTLLWSPVMAEAISAALPTRDQVVPSRKRVKLPPWLEVAKPRLILCFWPPPSVVWRSPRLAIVIPASGLHPGWRGPGLCRSWSLELSLGAGS